MPNQAIRTGGASLSERAKARMQSGWGEPLFVADWDNVRMIHFAVDAKRLQHNVPFELDTSDGMAFVSMVAFTMREMRPAFANRLLSWVLWPLSTHHFFNVRTYVRAGGDAGIHFLAEWVPNRLAMALGPRTFSLPYRQGRITYQNDWRAGKLHGRVDDAKSGAAFAYRGELEAGAPFSQCAPGSLDAWLMERYSAFNAACGRKRFFHVWHEPWLQCKAQVTMPDTSLLEADWDWFRNAEFAGANYSPGVRDVWLGWPHPIKSSCRSSN